MHRFTFPPQFFPVLVALVHAGCASAELRPPVAVPVPDKPPSNTTTVPSKDTLPHGPVEVALLFTTDEHGWLESLSRDGTMRGGVAALGGQWVRDEGHCPGPAPFAINSDESFVSLQSENCVNPKTLVLSGGDNFTGPAISTYYAGEPMAQAMGRLGYAASAFGNHEFDFGRAQFPKLRDQAKLRYLSANAQIHDPALAKELDVRPFEIFERRGIRIGVIGLSTVETPKAALAERFVGITFEPPESALSRTVPNVWDAGADVLVVIAHECPDVLAPVISKHPEWRLTFVGGGHCHKKMHEHAGEVSVMSPEWRMHQYVRVILQVDRALPAQSRVQSIKTDFVDTAASSKVFPDPVLTELVKVWKEKTDKALGVTLGHSKSGIGPELNVGQMVANAWLAELGGDVAIVNKGGIRQVIPTGPITHGTIWGVLPFDNRLMKLSVLGADLVKEIENSDFIAAGAEKRANGKWFIGKKPLDEKKRYTVFITDYMYTGGDASGFGKYDPQAIGTGIQWRDPVIAWIGKQKTTPTAPLEDKLPKPAK